jgi:hypothetical protein
MENKEIECMYPTCTKSTCICNLPTPELDLEERANEYVWGDNSHEHIGHYEHDKDGYEVRVLEYSDIENAYKKGYTDCAHQKQQEFVKLVDGEIANNTKYINAMNDQGTPNDQGALYRKRYNSDLLKLLNQIKK